MSETAKMTPEWVRECVQKIAALAGDPEMAHSKEDSLYIAVLEAIAEGHAGDPAACAKAALEAHDLDFTRWYA